MTYPLSRQGFALRLAIAADLPPMAADADAIEQAILNLLSNAMKYSGQGREIELRLERQDGHAVISVTDWGVGIPVDEHERIFEKFYRVAGPELQLIPGTGLGLTLVAHTVEAHGGRVTVRSAPGEGSTFSMLLPLVQLDGTGPTPEHLPRPEDSGQWRRLPPGETVDPDLMREAAPDVPDDDAARARNSRARGFWPRATLNGSRESDDESAI